MARTRRPRARILPSLTGGGAHPGSPAGVLSRPRGGARWYRKPRQRNHLDGASSKSWTRSIPTGFYWYLAVLACIGGFLFGYDTSNIGSALGFIPYHLSSFATGYLVAGASLGAAAGALIAGPLTDRFGRKSLLITDAAIYAIGAILSAVTINAVHAARVPDAHRAGDRSGLRDRHLLYRRVRAPQPARPAQHHPAVDDHRGHPGLLPGRPGHPQSSRRVRRAAWTGGSFSASGRFPRW